MAMYTDWVSVAVGLVQIQRHMHSDAWGASHLLWMIGWLVMDVFVGISVTALGIAQASQVARNVTTNELANWHRYKYLQGPDGRSFYNPFSRGVQDNCKETCFPDRVPMAPVYLSREQIAAAAAAHACGGGGCRSCHH